MRSNKKMKKLYGVIGKIIFYVFVIVVGLWTASLTLAEMKSILPDDPLTPYFALALFDGGALAWLMAWTGHARGLAQRAISAIMLVLDLIGITLLAAGRLLGGGQTLVAVSDSLATAVIYGVIGATLINLAAVYAFHITDPDVMEEIETGLLVDTIRAESQKQASANIESQAQQLGAIMAARATGNLKYNLRLPMNEAEAANVIEVQSRDVASVPPRLPEPKKASVLDVWMKAAADKIGGMVTPKPQRVYEQSLHNITPEQSSGIPDQSPAPAGHTADQDKALSVNAKSFSFTLPYIVWWHDKKLSPMEYSIEDNNSLYAQTNFPFLVGKLTEEEAAILKTGELPATFIRETEEVKLQYEAKREKEREELEYRRAQWDNAPHGERTVQDVMDAGECSCPLDFTGRIPCTQHDTRALRAAAKRTCEGCAFFKKADG
jgi:hypothetical protein